MKNFQKIILMAVFFVLPQIACNSQNKASEAETKQAASSSIAMNNDAQVRVFNISDVKKIGTNKASDFTWTENGKTYKFSEYTKGKVVFINFWGTWCPPCRAEIPDIIELSNDYSGKDFVVIGMASERPNEANPLDKVSQYAKDKKITYLNFISNDAIRANFGGIQFVPTTFIVDKEGNIVETINGMRDKAGFKASIDKVLK